MITGIAKFFYDVTQCDKNIVIDKPKKKQPEYLNGKLYLLGQGEVDG